MYRLKIVDREGKTTTLDLDPGRRFGIGRSEDNEIALPDPLVSRSHAEIYHEDGDWHVRDRGSSNGTFVDDLPVGGSMLLRPGAVISIGDSRLHLKAPEAPRERVKLQDGPIPSEGTIMLSAPDVILSSGEAVSGESEVEPLRRRLRTIEQANLKLLAHVPLEELLPKIVDLVYDALRPDLVALLCAGDDGELACRAFRATGEREIAISQTIARTVIGERSSILTADAQSDPRFASGKSVLGIRAAMAAPLWDNREVVGLVYAESRMDAGRFDHDDLRLLTVLANVAAIQMRNAALFEEQMEKQRFEREAAAAAKIQRRLLPGEPPALPGYALEASSIPCFEVGGDYYDFTEDGSGRHRFVLADVAGKGMGAALLMAGLQAGFQARAASTRDLAALAGQLNSALVKSSPADRFVTLFLLEVDPESHRVRWVNAGHAPSPVVLRAAGSLETLPSGGVPAGILPGVDYPVAEFELREGDVVFASSDGVTDVENAAGEPYGEPRLHRLLESLAGRSPAEVRAALESDLGSFRGGTEAPDDVTFMILGRMS